MRELGTLPAVSKTTAPPVPAPTGGRVTDRLGEAGSAGWAPVPDVLLFNQHKLGLRSEDLNVLLNLMAHWYVAEVMPFIRPSTISKRMGVSTRSVQRSIARLIKLGLVTKERPGQGKIVYNLLPLIERLRPFAEERALLKQGRLEAQRFEYLISETSEPKALEFLRSRDTA